MRRQNNTRETWKPDNDNSKQGTSHSSQAKAPPVILDRRVKVTPRQEEKKVEEEKTDELVVPFMKRPGKFNTDVILKKLAEYPGHFVVGVVGKQGVGKSTILSQFAPQPNKQGHKTEGIDMYVTPERVILLDTEPLLCWAVLEKALRSETLEGMNPDVWLEMGNIYNIIFLMSICNVLLVVSEGPKVDLDLSRLVQRSELLKFNIPEYPLLTGQREVNYYPQVVFVCNKCQRREFSQDKYTELQKSIETLYKESELKTAGLIDFSRTDFSFHKQNDTNVYLLPEMQPNPAERHTEPFNHFVLALRDQILCAPRKPGKRGQVSEKDWFRNAMKTYELIHKSEFVNEYLQTVRKLRDS